MTHNFRSIGEGSHDSLSPVPTTDWRLDGHRHLCGLCQAPPDVSADPTATGGGPMTRCPQCAFLVPKLAGDVCAVCTAQAPVQHIQRDIQTPWRIEHTLRTLFPPKPPAQARPIFVQPTPTPEARSPQPCEIPGCGGGRPADQERPGTDAHQKPPRALSDLLGAPPWRHHARR